MSRRRRAECIDTHRSPRSARSCDPCCAGDLARSAPRRAGARRSLCPGCPARHTAGGVRPGRAVRADGRERALRRADRRAARAWGGRRSRQDRTVREGPRAGPLPVPPRLSRERARPGLRLRAVGAACERGPQPTVYAHVATDPAHPGKLALQYWLFYAFNDWNNLHEGDWEMIQLVFDAATRATRSTSSRRGRLQPARGSGAGRLGRRKARARRRYASGRDPAAGSHANFFGEALFLGSSAEQGVGCDDTTRAASRSASGRARPSRATRLRRASGFRGSRSRAAGENCSPRSSTGRPGRISRRNGQSRSDGRRTGGRELHGPVRRVSSARARRISSAARSVAAHRRSSGSRAARCSSHSWPARSSCLLIYAFSRTTWRPTATLRLAHRRAWGQILAAASRMYAAHCVWSSASGSCSSRSRCWSRSCRLCCCAGRASSGSRAGRRATSARLCRGRNRDRADAARPGARPGGNGRALSSSSTMAERSAPSLPTGWRATAFAHCSAHS